MAVIDAVARELHLNPDDLIKESLKTYLEKRLSKVEADIFLLAKKHGVKDVFEMDEKISKGLVSEKDAYDDYFTLDNLEAERDKLKDFLKQV